MHCAPQGGGSSPANLQLGIVQHPVAHPPVFSITCAMLILQPFCFDGLPFSWGGGGSKNVKNRIIHSLSLIPNTLSSFFSHACALFCTQQKLNPFIFKLFRTLCQKPPGVGRVILLTSHPSSPVTQHLGDDPTLVSVNGACHDLAGKAVSHYPSTMSRLTLLLNSSQMVIPKHSTSRNPTAHEHSRRHYRKAHQDQRRARPSGRHPRRHPHLRTGRPQLRRLQPACRPPFTHSAWSVRRTIPFSDQHG